MNIQKARLPGRENANTYPNNSIEFLHGNLLGPFHCGCNLLLMLITTQTRQSSEYKFHFYSVYSSIELQLYIAWGNSSLSEPIKTFVVNSLHSFPTPLACCNHQASFLFPRGAIIIIILLPLGILPWANKLMQLLLLLLLLFADK